MLEWHDGERVLLRGERGKDLGEQGDWVLRLVAVLAKLGLRVETVGHGGTIGEVAGAELFKLVLIEPRDVVIVCGEKIFDWAGVVELALWLLWNMKSLLLGDSLEKSPLPPVLGKSSIRSISITLACRSIGMESGTLVAIIFEERRLLSVAIAGQVVEMLATDASEECV